MNAVVFALAYLFVGYVSFLVYSENDNEGWKFRLFCLTLWPLLILMTVCGMVFGLLLSLYELVKVEK